MASPDNISKRSLDDQVYVESKREIPSPFDKSMFRKTRIFDKSPSNLGKSLIMENFSSLSPGDKFDKMNDVTSPKVTLFDFKSNLE